jgi:activator of HSP90 ATPase
MKYSTSPADMARRRILLAGGFMALGAAALARAGASDQSTSEVSRDAEAIHQEPFFKAERARVYEALTTGEKFDRIIKLTSVMQSAAKSGRMEPTRMSPRAGSTFALFGGYIVGRQIELASPELIVQAWRVVNWSPGIYSIARFQLADESGGTRIVFDHTGFPKGQGEHLASGWHEHYWDPLAKFLSG